MQVKELMSRIVMTVGTEDSCRDALTRMRELKLRHLPVMDLRGKLAGMLTDRDLRHYLFDPAVMRRIGVTPVDVILESVSVREIMSAPVLSVDPEEDMEAAVGLMRKRKVGSLPVVKDGQVVGILTETDVLRRIVRVDATCSPGVEEIIVSYP
jgi:acetoin utilization protein AcuB